MQLSARSIPCSVVQCCGRNRIGLPSRVAQQSVRQIASHGKRPDLSCCWRQSLPRQLRLPVQASASAGAVPEPEGHHHKHKRRGGGPILWGLGVGAAIAACSALYVSGHAAALQTYLMDGPLGRSGLLASFCLIFLSELGDKTFFIAALLAMKLGRWISFVGSLSALAVMTLISVGIGAAFSRVPESLQSSLPVGEIAGVALLVFFGIKALKAAQDAEGSSTSSSEDELADAQVAVEEATSSGRIKGSSSNAFGSLFEVASLIFLAEWGDRSMLATIALGAAQNPIGVAIGATAGHAAATALAVAGGALAGKYISEKTVNYISGALFLLFAAATVYTMM